MKKLKVAQVGAGNFGSARRSLMRQTGLFNLVAVYDWNEKAMDEARLEDGAQPVASYEELLEFPGIEAVIVSTGAKFHAAQTIAAIERGLPVFVEKPLCSTPEEVRQLLECEEKYGTLVAVGNVDHTRRAVSRTILNLLKTGELGKVAAFEATTAHSGGLQIKPGEWRGEPENNPGGMLFQCGVHILHELLFYFGPIEEIYSSMRYDLHTTRTADVAMCHLRFKSGVIGSLHAYHVTPYRHTLSIFGTKASVYRDDRFFDEGTTLEIQKGRLDNGCEEKVPVPLIGKTDAAGNLRSFYNAVTTGTPVYPSLKDGAQAVLAVFSAQQSAETGRPVRVPNLESSFSRTEVAILPMEEHYSYANPIG